jgi:succinoglycan biosynthesis protein ExoA
MIPNNQNDSPNGRQTNPSPAASVPLGCYSIGRDTPLRPPSFPDVTNLISQSPARRVLHLIGSNFVGGPEKQILRHAFDCQTGGQWEICVGSFREGSKPSALLARARDIGLTSLELQRGHFNPLAVSELVALLRQHQISILCTHGYRANILGWMACRIYRCPQIGFARGWTAETWKVKLYESCDRILLGRMNWVACVSRPLAENLQNSRKGRRPPIIIPNAALFLSEPESLQVDRQAFRRSLGLPESAFVVGAVGRLSAEKGHRYLLESVPSLLRRIPNLMVILLGEGREQSNLERYREDLGIQDAVIFKGFQNDVRPWIQAMNVLVNPSLTEGTPNVVLEAMALGTPVVASAVGGVPDLIRDGETGLLFPSADSGALAENVLRIQRDRGLALTLADGAQSWLRSHFSPERQQQQLFELYEAVLQGPGPQKNLAAEDLSVKPEPARDLGSSPQAAPSRKSAKQLPFISVVIPARNERAHIGSVLQDLLQQNYPTDRFEILVVDGNSTDQTCQLVDEFRQGSAVRILRLENPALLSSAGRNVGAKAACGEFIIFIDGHCRIPSKTLLLDAVELFEKTRADCLCRPQPLTMPGNTVFQDVVAHARATPLGHGRDSTIYALNWEGPVNPSSSGALYRREAFDRVGFFDERLDACEDVDFNYRVFKAGLHSYFSPKLAVFYRPRSDFKSLWKQMLRYGRGRCRLVRKHPDAFSVSQMIPPALLVWLGIGGIASLCSGRFAELFLATLAFYVAVVLGFSARLALRYGWSHLVLAPVVYLWIHLGLGAGFLAEFLQAGSGRSSFREKSMDGPPIDAAHPNPNFRQEEIREQGPNAI